MVRTPDRGMRGATIRSDIRALRAKARRVAHHLEEFLGLPQQGESLPPPLDMLIATILSQNTNDKNSHRAYTLLRRKYPRWEDVAHAPLRSIVAAIRSGGMANQKAARIKQVLAIVNERFGAFDLKDLYNWPDQDVIDELVQLKGVGLKTAACVLLFSLRRDVFPVDTHVHRICSRLGLVPGQGGPERTFELMRTIIPKGKGYSFHTNLIRFGRRVCRSANPACNHCPVVKECLFVLKRAPGSARRILSQSTHDFMLLDNVS